MKLNIQLFVLSAIFALPTAAFADCSPYPDQQDYYFSSGSMNHNIIPPPPADGSPEDRADLGAVRDWSRTRSQAQCQAFQTQKAAQLRTFFSRLPVALSPENERTFCRVASDISKAVGVLKDKYGRLRPPARDSSIRTCPGGSAGGQAYPSGHAALSRAYARVLAEIDPANQETYFAEAKQAGLNRVIGSVHHPLDVIHGAELADKIVDEMLKNPSFRSDLKAIK